MRYIGIFILLVLCLPLLLLTDCMTNKVKPEPVYPQQWATGTGTVGDPWAGDCIDDAIAAASAGDTIYLRAGYYQLSGECAIRKDNLTIMGAGINKTFVLTDNAHGFSFDRYNHITICDLTIDGTAQTGWCFGIYPANCDYTTVRNVEIKNCSNCGINSYQCNYGLFENLSLHDNGEHGIHPCSNELGRNKYNTYRNIDCYNNVEFGFSDRGNGEAEPLAPLEPCYNVYDNIHVWDNGYSGIQVSFQKNATITNCSSENNGDVGLRFISLADSTITNCTSIGNSIDTTNPGIYIYGAGEHASYIAENLIFTNVVSKNTDGDPGVQLNYYADNITFDSCQFYDDQDTMTQTYGARLTGDNVSNIYFINCKLTPNISGAIYNPNGVAVKVITEKNVGQF
jgi:hypothetical protein